MNPVFVLATANEHKAAEIADILAGSFDLAPRPPELHEVEETGDTLLDNARLKARAVMEATGQAAIADDTGLEVDALGGAPGVFTARYAGPDATYADNVTKLLAALAGCAGSEDRRAVFRTVVVAMWPDGSEVTAEGAVAGTIAESPRGTGGFGYDPVFVPADGGGLTFAELADESSQAKHRLSHRGRALRQLVSALADRP